MFVAPATWCAVASGMTMTAAVDCVCAVFCDCKANTLANWPVAPGSVMHQCQDLCHKLVDPLSGPCRKGAQGDR